MFCESTGLLYSRSRSQQLFKMFSLNVCSDGILWTTESFVTKLYMVIHRHKPECHKTESLLPSRSWSQKSYDQNMAVPIISSELLILLWPNLVWWSVIVSCRAVWKYRFPVFKVTVQNFNECLVGWSEWFKFLWTDLVWWCNITNQDVMQKGGCVMFRVKVTVWADIIQIRSFLLYL